mmetsp:Transcript_6034/g.16815  ORF Transcript_6034/g.16815 Transcript_6034/m.16815 type:complete len:181 (+) Transcript_6034:1082-1624(+)
MKFHFMSILAPLSSYELINEDNLMRLPGPVCGGDTGAYCCDQPWMWRMVGLFTDVEDARRFMHYVTSDLTSHLSASDGPFHRFLYPLSKDLRSWEHRCPAASESLSEGMEAPLHRLIGGILEEDGSARAAAASHSAGNSRDLDFQLFESQKRRLGLSSPDSDLRDGDRQGLGKRTKGWQT